jgi:hypothetical protein
VNKETIDEIEQLAKESGGVFFICILDKDYENEKPVIIRDYGSPVLTDTKSWKNDPVLIGFILSLSIV